MNDIGIVACLMDNNLNEQFFLQYEKQRNLLDQHLHPAQFLQVCAMIVYKASLLYRQPFYITHYDEQGNPVDIVSIESTGTHQFVTCSCGACSVDGGHEYLRRCAPSEKDFTDISIVETEKDAGNASSK